MILKIWKLKIPIIFSWIWISNKVISELSNQKNWGEKKEKESKSGKEKRQRKEICRSKRKVREKRGGSPRCKVYILEGPVVHTGCTGRSKINKLNFGFSGPIHPGEAPKITKEKSQQFFTYRGGLFFIHIMCLPPWQMHIQVYNFIYLFIYSDIVQNRLPCTFAGYWYTYQLDKFIILSFKGIEETTCPRRWRIIYFRKYRIW